MQITCPLFSFISLCLCFVSFRFADVIGGSCVMASVGPSQGSSPTGKFLVTVNSLAGTMAIAPQQSGNFRLEAMLGNTAGGIGVAEEDMDLQFEIEQLKLQLVVEDMNSGSMATGFLSCFPGQVAASISGECWSWS